MDAANPGSISAPPASEVDALGNPKARAAQVHASKLPSQLQVSLTAAHQRVCQFVERQAGAVKDWRTDASSIKHPGRVYYVQDKGTFTHAFCPDMAIDATSQVRMEGGTAGAAVLQEPVKAGSMLQLPGGILTKALGFVIDLRKADISLNVVLGWPTKQALSDNDMIEGHGVHVSHGTQSVLPLDNGDIGLLISVSKQYLRWKIDAELNTAVPCHAGHLPSSGGEVHPDRVGRRRRSRFQDLGEPGGFRQ